MSHQKEIAKFLKLISAKKLEKNHKECIELYNIVGGIYSEIGSYDEAAHYHEQALDLCKTIGDRLGTALAFRYIGEAKASLGSFNQAIDFIKKYLELAEKLSNKVEIQRAWTTLGRVYLMQAQELKDKSNVVDRKTKEAAREAEKKFSTALNLAESVRSQVDDKEYAQMTSGLLINLGLIKDICGQYQEATVKLNRAIETCRRAKLKDDLYRCQIVLAGIYRQRNDIKLAVRVSEEALQTAKSLGKKLLICEALIERGQVRICQRDFKNAKRTFAQAYLEKSPSEEDHNKAIKLTKLAHLIASNYEKLCKDNTASESRLKLCDKLGDLFIAIGNFKLAIEFYRRAFADAKVCSKPKSELARILFSVAETYADDGQFKHALVCYEKELTYRNGNEAEQCQSLIKIAHMHEYLEHDPPVVSEAYEKALDKAGKDPKLMHSVLRYYVPYLLQKAFNASRYRELDDTLTKLKSYPEVVEDNEEEDFEESNELEDEIADVEDVITDDEDNDEVLMIGRRKARGANKFKPNEVGDTPLHEAAIKGNLRRVKSLVAQGHEINPRDNAGWIPLHEACNHGHYDIAEFLIEHGADVNNRGLKGMSPLHDSATNGHFDIMRLLIKNGANVIALTDTGETVLSCLRDFRKRNYSAMSNQSASEYKQMEAELLNVMDKCGYNLMSENMKNLGTRPANADLRRTATSAHLSSRSEQPQNQNQPPTSRVRFRSGAAGDDQQKQQQQQQLVRPKVQIEPSLIRRNQKDSSERELTPKKNQIPTSEPEKPNPHSVREYRDAITTLKRKRPIDVNEPNKRASQPATVASSISTSVPTKQWLLSDDIIEEDEEEEEDNDVLFSKPAKTKPSWRETIREEEEEDDVMLIEERSPATNRKRIVTPSLPREDTSQDLDLPELRSPSPSRDHSPMLLPMEDWDKSFSPTANKQRTSTSGENRSNTATPFDLLTQPLVVTIEGRKLLVPIKDEHTTVGELKQSIVDRYSLLANAKPKISLAPASEPECFLFDADLCRDVVREKLVATVDSWQLDSIESTYLAECRHAQLEPLDFVKLEMRALDETGDKLSLAYLRFPRSHLKPITQSLARRNFTFASFQGSSAWFECRKSSRDLLSGALCTWTSLARLNLKCSGLSRFHFELLCNASGQQKHQLPRLEEIDASVNSIAYKERAEFVSQVEKLRQLCPSLRRLDVRKNHLLFGAKSQTTQLLIVEILCLLSSDGAEGEPEESHE